MAERRELAEGEVHVYWARPEQILDPESFREIGTLTATIVGEGERPAPADAFPAGFGRI